MKSDFEVSSTTPMAFGRFCAWSMRVWTSVQELAAGTVHESSAPETNACPEQREQDNLQPLRRECFILLVSNRAALVGWPLNDVQSFRALLLEVIYCAACYCWSRRISAGRHLCVASLPARVREEKWWQSWWEETDGSAPCAVLGGP